MLQPRRLAVSSVEAVGAYTLLRLVPDGGDLGEPGQFFMLTAEPKPATVYLPRALSPAWADANELAFLLDVAGRGHPGAGGHRRGLDAGSAGTRL